MGPTDNSGIMGGLDFGVIKKKFRKYIDDAYDHKLLLNSSDPLLLKWCDSSTHTVADVYPGARLFDGDPTIENVARWMCKWAQEEFHPLSARVNVQETNTNGAEVGY